MVYRSRFYPHYKEILRRKQKEAAAAAANNNKSQKNKKDNSNNKTFLDNPRDIQNFIWTHIITDKELR